MDGIRGDRAPGDILIINEEHDESSTLLRSPTPSDDPNDPLNWSSRRKFFNYALVSAQSVAVFTALSTQTNFWQQMSVDMGLTFEQLNNAQSANLAGLAMGCVFFIPLTKKYGRRSTYVVSTAVMAAIAWWSAYMKTTAELFLTNLFFGLAGATNETIVQMTIADMFFLHQRGTANAIYLTAVMVGSFLTPMAAGVQAQSQGWRKSYLALAISLSVLFAIFLVGYEETKYVPVVHGLSTTLEVGAEQAKNNDDGTKKPVELQGTALELTASKPGVSTNVPLNSYRQRLRWITPTSESLLKIAYFPIYVIVLPHVMYAALQYASGVCWLVIQASILSIVFSKPPYNFSTAGIGLMSLGPFVGNLLGSFYTGLLTDRSIRWLAKRNGGYYEPEMRLYLLLPPAILMAGGQIMFGITTDRGMHWIYPSVGGALFAFGLGAIGDAAFTLVIDAYRPLTAEAFVGVAFVRNAVSIPIPFAITPWLKGMGLTNMFVTCGVVSLVISSLFVPMIIWGKRMRAALAPRYYMLLDKQGILAVN
ncbi:major facilitator superfamily domain-containing protein [Macrophomina phaseolina]|uniref:Major facilitator superfamily domain-containing protein n=1 Tax=Macrophomina phaseolina TaxID=35725 RepID=A0ABQ8G3S3_9PEZI|nr:major facilitator superfamily domain-containing protein [Macrophomina phaseolina]